MKKSLKKCTAILLVVVSLLFFSLLFVGCNSNNTTEQEVKKYVNIPPEHFVQFTLLNSNTIYANGQEISVRKHNEIVKQIENTLIAISKAVNTTIADSTVFKINSAGAGQEVEIDLYTKELLEISQEAFTKSGGKFSPALYNLSQIWGFTPEFENSYNKPRPEPSADVIAQAKANSNFNDLDLSKLAQNIVSKKNAALKLDFGGIAKGYMADKVEQVIENALPNMQIDCGFQVMSNTVLMGQRRDGNSTRGFNIAIENPRQSVTGYGDALIVKDIQDVAVSTSADTYRFYAYENEIYSHIIDYNTGKPANNGVISATVLVLLAKDFSSTWTDIYSTLGFCMPLTEVLNFYEKENIGAAVITNDYNYYITGTLGKEKIVNPHDFDSRLQNYYTNNTGNATDTFKKSPKELDYIAGKGNLAWWEEEKPSMWSQVITFLVVFLLVIGLIFIFIIVFNRGKK